MTVRAHIKGLAFGGSGVGEVVDESDNKGKRIFVPFTIPGELIDAEILRSEKRHIEGKLLNVLEPSPFREKPPCPYFNDCGGCDLQHQNIQSQRSAKLNMVESALLMQANLRPTLGFSLLGENLAAWNYRRRVTLHLSYSGELGFYRRGSGDVVDIEKCLITSAAINSKFESLRSEAKSLSSNVGSLSLEEVPDGIGLACRLRSDLAVVPAEVRASIDRLRQSFQILEVISLKGSLLLSLGNRAQVSLGHFSQVNQEANAVLVAQVIELLKGDDITDFYAGAGNFSIPLALSGKNVTAVEVNPTLVDIGTQLAQEKAISSRLKFIGQSCEKYVKTGLLTKSILLDPPRSGARAVVEDLQPNQVKEIIYVSCNLPSLGRDLKILSDKGFSLEKVWVLDMFAQTHHVEVIARVLAS